MATSGDNSDCGLEGWMNSRGFNADGTKTEEPAIKNANGGRDSAIIWSSEKDDDFIINIFYNGDGDGDDGDILIRTETPPPVRPSSLISDCLYDAIMKSGITRDSVEKYARSVQSKRDRGLALIKKSEESRRVIGFMFKDRPTDSDEIRNEFAEIRDNTQIASDKMYNLGNRMVTEANRAKSEIALMKAIIGFIEA